MNFLCLCQGCMSPYKEGESHPWSPNPLLLFQAAAAGSPGNQALLFLPASSFSSLYFLTSFHWTLLHSRRSPTEVESGKSMHLRRHASRIHSGNVALWQQLSYSKMRRRKVSGGFLSYEVMIKQAFLPACYETLFWKGNLKESGTWTVNHLQTAPARTDISPINIIKTTCLYGYFYIYLSEKKM